jgi:hypothetical protein
MQGHPSNRNRARVAELASNNRKPYIPFTQDECLGWPDAFLDSLPVVSVDQAKEAGWSLLTDVGGPATEIKVVLHHTLVLADREHKNLGVTKNPSGGILVWIRPETEKGT